MKVFLYAFLFLLLNSCNLIAQTSKSFVKVKGIHFYIGDQRYYFVGSNFWYGMNLGSKGEGGDRARLVRELDALKKLGINNLRILALTEGPDSEPFRIIPSVQPTPGNFDESLLEGLDYLLSEMSKRDMYAVVCLGDFWHWSGGLGQYLVWANKANSIPYPPPHQNGSWETYQRFASLFYSVPLAKEMYLNAVKKIITRKNSITGKAYTEDPTIMSWQLANEPRGIDNEKDFNNWVDSTAGIIKNLDKNHLVNVGLEGYTPYKNFAGTNMIEVNNGKNIDYTTAHIWVQNWEWYDPKNHKNTYPIAIANMKKYLIEHIDAAKTLGKPLVIEEFGIGRDSGSHETNSYVTVRDQYYATMFQEIFNASSSNTPVAGVNFWAWGGEGRPKKAEGMWNKEDQFIGDPPHETQGWYSVYDKDFSTHKIIKKYATKMKQLK